MNLLQFNTTVNTGSTGRHTENIAKILIQKGHQSHIVYGRGNPTSESRIVKTGNKLDQALHLVKTRLADMHGLGSEKSSGKVMRKIDEIRPDIFHLHNIHGYYLNYKVLFKYLRKANRPVIWTFHDCWPFTGHCSHFEFVKCYRWKTKCGNCPNRLAYPKSWLVDRSAKNFDLKKQLFTSLQNLTIVTPSVWLKRHVENSFFSDYPVHVIHNGIDLNHFKLTHTSEIRKKLNLEGKKVILGVSNVWTKRKGYYDFIKLRDLLPKNYAIVLAGIGEKQTKKIADNIIALPKTNSIEEMASYYSLADVYANLTWSDNFPTTNLEALACGTPVITYDTGGSGEAADENTGRVIRQGDIKGFAETVTAFVHKGKQHFSEACRKRAEEKFNMNDRNNDYLKLYEEILNSK